MVSTTQSDATMIDYLHFQSVLQLEFGMKTSGWRTSVLEISQLKELNGNFSPRRGLDCCITTPAGIHKNLLIDDNEIRSFRFMTENKGIEREEKWCGFSVKTTKRSQRSQNCSTTSEPVPKTS